MTAGPLSSGEAELRVEADFTRLPDVRHFVGRAAEQLGLPRADVYQVKMAVSEAVANAIEHGSDEGDEITVLVARDADTLVVLIRDSGTFVPRVKPRGELPERGRGLEFMTKIMDEVDVRPGAEGTEVRLAKRLRGADG